MHSPVQTEYIVVPCGVVVDIKGQNIWPGETLQSLTDDQYAAIKAKLEAQKAKKETQE